MKTDTEADEVLASSVTAATHFTMLTSHCSKACMHGDIIRLLLVSSRVYNLPLKPVGYGRVCPKPHHDIFTVMSSHSKPCCSTTLGLKTHHDKGEQWVPAAVPKPI